MVYALTLPRDIQHRNYAILYFIRSARPDCRDIGLLSYVIISDIASPTTNSRPAFMPERYALAILRAVKNAPVICERCAIYFLQSFSAVIKRIHISFAIPAPDKRPGLKKASPFFNLFSFSNRPFQRARAKDDKFETRLIVKLSGMWEKMAHSKVAATGGARKGGLCRKATFVHVRCRKL